MSCCLPRCFHSGRTGSVTPSMRVPALRMVNSELKGWRKGGKNSPQNTGLYYSVSMNHIDQEHQVSILNVQLSINW